MAKADLTAERLREVLDYDPDTGVFTWRRPAGLRMKPGDRAGTHSPANRGYVLIGLSRRTYKAHRLAWMHVYGRWPNGEIDHINGDRADNRIANLREATKEINAQNRRSALRGSASGLLGAHWHKRTRLWLAKILLGGKAIHLGSFRTPEEAHAKYVEAKRQIHQGCTI